MTKLNTFMVVLYSNPHTYTLTHKLFSTVLWHVIFSHSSHPQYILHNIPKKNNMREKLYDKKNMYKEKKYVTKKCLLSINNFSFFLLFIFTQARQRTYVCLWMKKKHENERQRYIISHSIKDKTEAFQYTNAWFDSLLLYFFLLVVGEVDEGVRGRWKKIAVKIGRRKERRGRKSSKKREFMLEIFYFFLFFLTFFFLYPRMFVIFSILFSALYFRLFIIIIVDGWYFTAQ